jgi:hypothetical protein
VYRGNQGEVVQEVIIATNGFDCARLQIPCAPGEFTPELLTGILRKSGTLREGAVESVEVEEAPVGSGFVSQPAPPRHLCRYFRIARHPPRTFLEPGWLGKLPILFGRTASGKGHPLALYSNPRFIAILA